MKRTIFVSLLIDRVVLAESLCVPVKLIADQFISFKSN
jgi:hypothetical protein